MARSSVVRACADSCMTARISSRLPKRPAGKGPPARPAQQRLRKWLRPARPAGAKRNGPSRKRLGRREAQLVGVRAEQHLRQQIEQRVEQKNNHREDDRRSERNGPGNIDHAGWTMTQPRMKKLASVLPTRIVHRKFSGFSRNSCSNLADGRPARAFAGGCAAGSAQTRPPPCPDNRNDSARQSRQKQPG